jgi:hypothetical protein
MKMVVQGISMTLADWVTRYESKTGEQFSVPDGFKLAFDEQRGFFYFKADCKGSITFFN